jgi:hypothetical protein
MQDVDPDSVELQDFASLLCSLLGVCDKGKKIESSSARHLRMLWVANAGGDVHLTK